MTQHMRQLHNATLGHLSVEVYQRVDVVQGVHKEVGVNLILQILHLALYVLLLQYRHTTVGVEGADAVVKGLEMTLKGAEDALSRMGVEAFGASGDAFDPNMHSAMMMVDDENYTEGQIVTVFQKGYKKGDRIIRYAMVTVAN